MKKGSVKITALVLTAGLTLAENGSILYAAGTDTVLAGLGELKAAAETEAKNTEDLSLEESEVVEQTADEAPEEDAFVPDTDAKGTTGFALCDEYLNVRSSADKESDVVGKIKNYGALEIVDVDEYGWYKVRSGNVEGYVAGQYVATGSLAEEIAADAGYTYAEVGAEVLNVRSDASTDSDVVATLTDAQEVEVVEDNGDWVKVVVDGTYGYVSSDYVNTSIAYATAETLEEEQQRLDEEWIAYLEQEASALEEPVYDAPAASYTESYSSVSYEPAYDTGYDAGYDASYSTVDTSWAAAEAEAAQAEADLQYQEYLNAQAAADEAAASGDEQAVYEAEAAAQEAYQVFEEAQTTADEAAATAAETAAYTETYEDTYTEDGYDASYYEEAYNDTTYTDAAYADPAYTDASYTDNGEQAAADALYQAYVDAQSAADEAAAGADEQAVYDTAAAASEAYEQYVAAQEAADAAAQSAADAQAYGTAQDTSSDQTYTETYDETYTDTYTDTYTEETYEDTSYTEEAASYSSTGSSVANYALQFVGNPYVYGGSSLTNGADCSGFVMAVYENFGISLPHNAAAQSGCGTSVSLDSLQPGDLLFYSDGSGIGHVSMYIGNNQVVHASNPTNGIIVSDMSYRTPVSAVRLV